LDEVKAMDLQFEPLPVAAKRLGRNLQHVRRLCQRWQLEGKARKFRPEGGGVERWEVSRDVVLPERPAPAAARADAGFDESRLNKANRLELHRRENLVCLWRGERDRPGPAAIRVRMEKFRATIRDKSPRLKVPSDRAIYRWIRDYETYGLAGLADGRWPLKPLPQPAPATIQPKAIDATLGHRRPDDAAMPREMAAGAAAIPADSLASLVMALKPGTILTVISPARDGRQGDSSEVRFLIEASKTGV
jgi:hypothetical protein